MKNNRSLVTLFLFISGFCSLAYQVVWLREFRLVFGGSSAAGSAVLAVFMGSLGCGGWVLGKKLDKSEYPGRFYAWTEIIIAFTVLISPLLLTSLKSVYFWTGGVTNLGPFGSSLIHMTIAIIVLGVPTFFMGATLPAAASVLQNNKDENRQGTATLYGLNIAGAVLGAFSVNFYFLEMFGNTKTLLIIAMLNLLLGVMAYISLAKSEEARKVVFQKNSTTPDSALIYSLAFFSGFIFFVSEMLWFRSSIPLLGGSVYNFGLILVIVLLGMSLGGGAYSISLKYFKPSLKMLAVASSLFALTISLPYLMGDNFAQFCTVLQSGYINYPFDQKIWVWLIIGGILVLPASFMAGFQFPIFLSLVGKGNDSIGSQVGKVYAFNTAGSVLGSIGAGFILIPKFSLSSTWYFIIALSVAAALITIIQLVKKYKLATSVWLSLIILFFVSFFSNRAEGITSFWQQNPIGFGRSVITTKPFVHENYSLRRQLKHAIKYSFDGKELSGGLSAGIDLGLLSNGKSDGSARADAPTQTMLGITGALLHNDDISSACVIGLGTGASAGWLSQIESIQQLDILELEPELINCAEYYDAVNFSVTKNPKVNIKLGDARELLMVDLKKKYDLIVSEPSNPQRAGVANLYTQEFYESVSAKLNKDGVFTQWLQAYEVNIESVFLVISTLKSVFPQVEIIQSQDSDILFVCRNKSENFNIEKISEKLNKFPYKNAMEFAWRYSEPEVLFSNYIANDDFCNEVQKTFPFINTDDLNKLEYDMGKSGGTSLKSWEVAPIKAMLEASHRLNMTFPPLEGSLSQDAIAAALASKRSLMMDNSDILANSKDPKTLKYTKRYDLNNILHKLRNDKNYDFKPVNEYERSIWGQLLASLGDHRALKYIENFKETHSLDYTLMRINYFRNKKNFQSEAEEIIILYKKLKNNLFSWNGYLEAIIKSIPLHIATNDKEFKPFFKRLYSVLETPSAAYLGETHRMQLRWIIARELGVNKQLELVTEYGENFPLSKKLLYEKLEIGKKLSNSSIIDSAHKDLDFMGLSY